MTGFDYQSCAEVFKRLDDYVDRELTPEEVEGIELHLRTCAMCASEFRFEESVIRNVRSKVDRLAVPPGLHARVWAATRGRSGD